MARFDAVFEGGGAKGVAFIGALDVLKQQGHELRRFIGTSAGAITATLLAAGYSTQEMMDAIMERQADGTPRFSTFMDIPPASTFTQEVRDNSVMMKIFQDVDLPLVPAAMEGKIESITLDRMLENSMFARLFSFVECGGYYCGGAFLAWLREKLAVKGILATDTLADFARKTGRDLSVCASDTTDMEILVLNHRTAPALPVANAVRMSMSIPFVWEEVVWREEWGTYMGREKKGNIIVDGGVLTNFPIRLIATLDDEIRQIMGDTDPHGAGNLGFLIDEKLPVPGAPDTAKTPMPVTRLRTVQRLSRLLETMTGASDNDMIRRYAPEICRLPAKGYGTLEFDMQGERLDMFIAAARDAMTKHLAQLPAV